MRYKNFTPLLLFFLPSICSVRIPPNPCPKVFSYYKDSRGTIYGEAIVPYDNSTIMELTVNASLVGRFTKTDLRIQMVTTLHELNDFTPSVIYNIFFPFQNVIPKITGITYNRRVYCSGPGEPVIPGTPGITNLWHRVYFQFTRRPNGYYTPDTKPDSSDTELPTKNPGERPQQRPPFIPFRKPSSEPTEDADLPVKRPESPQTAKPFIDDASLETFFTPTSSIPSPTSSPSLTNNEEFRCGVSSNQPPKNEIIPLIFNGQNTAVAEYPWLVALLTKKAQGEGYDYKCSGNLISANHVITAARCVQYYNTQIVRTEDIMLVMGTNSLLDWQTNGAVSRAVRKVQSHPAFKENSKSAHGDIAVLTMESPVEFSKVLVPVCLWKGNSDLYPFYNKTGSIVGYGQDEDAQQNGQFNVLVAKRGNMPIAPQAECLMSSFGLTKLTSDKTFCVRSGDVASGPCIGDSGSGFFIKLNGIAYLRGIASAITTKNGICDLTNQYSVFCDVAKFLDWIKAAMV